MSVRLFRVKVIWKLWLWGYDSKYRKCFCGVKSIGVLRIYLERLRFRCLNVSNSYILGRLSKIYVRRSALSREYNRAIFVIYQILTFRCDRWWPQLWIIFGTNTIYFPPTPRDAIEKVMLIERESSRLQLTRWDRSNISAYLDDYDRAIDVLVQSYFRFAVTSMCANSLYLQKLK